jgi:hypothetical protein
MTLTPLLFNPDLSIMKGNMMQNKMRRRLQSVGKTTFVKYFDVFEANSMTTDNSSILNEFCKNKETWCEKSCATKASAGKAIFRQGLELDALKDIACNSVKVPEEIVTKAMKYLYNRQG